MTESTSEYKKRIEEIKQSIESEPYMAKMREAIAEGISKTGIRQATVEEQFQSVLDETTGKDVISAPEIILARGGATTLRERLDSEKAEVSAQLAQVETQKANKLDVNYSLQNKRDISKKLELEDMSSTTLAAIEGAGATSFNLLSIPQDDSVTENKLTAETRNWLYKENIFSGNRKQWQYGDGDNPYLIPTNKIITPVKDRINVAYTKNVTLYFSDPTKRIAIRQYDVAGVKTNDSGWKYSNTINTIPILANTEKIGFLGSNSDNSTIQRYAFEDLEVLCVNGTTLSPFKKSVKDEKETLKMDTLDLTKKITLKNLIERDPKKWMNGLIGGDASTVISNNTTNATHRISMKVEYPGIDVSQVNKIYIKNLSGFDIGIIEADKDRYRVKDSGWVTVGEYFLAANTTEIYFVIKSKSNHLIYPSQIRNVEIYVGFLPYDNNMIGLSDLENSINKTINPMFVPSKIRFVAHRGFSSRAPENTLAAFELAGQNGFWGIEADVMPTSDNVLVIMHDDTVDRTTNGTGYVKDLTYAEIQNFTIDTGAGINEYPNEKVPTFREYLKVCKKYGAVPVIEIKGSNWTNSHLDLLMEMVIDYGFEESCVMTGFTTAHFDYIRCENKKIHVHPILDINANNIEIARLMGNSSINTGPNADIENMIKIAHKNGLMVNVHTINEETTKNQLIDYGVDMISTDVFNSN